jgi:ubiquinone/menaquinone biosynthesis C-methylase UbiE
MPKLNVEFEDYYDVSNHYDFFRQPVGINFILKSAEKHFINKKLDEISLLDCGCGTGNYLKKLSRKFGKCTGFEINEGMFNVARTKLAKQSNVTLYNESILDATTDEKFDVVLITQVLHHLDDEESNFKNLKIFIQNASNFLKEDGLLYINTCNPKYVKDSYWFYNILPRRVVDKYASKYAPLGIIKDSAKNFGLNLYLNQKVDENMMKEFYYFSEFGPLNASWRKSDSIWSLVSEEELDKIKKVVKYNIQNDNMRNYIYSIDNKNRHGQSVFLVFHKLF